MSDLTLFIPDKKLFSLNEFMSGWAAALSFTGIVSTCVGHPMDTIKVIQQVTNTGAIKATRTIYNHGYFRGMMFPVLSTGVVNSVFFGVNGNTMRLIQIYRSDKTKDDSNINIRFCCEADNLNKYWHLDVFVSGCIGGFFFSLINIPAEVVKTMLQATNISTLKAVHVGNAKKTEPTKITSPSKLFAELYKTNGIRSLYRGGMLLMMRDIPSMGTYMLTYEHVCCMLKRLSYLDNKSEKTKKDSMPRYIQILSGGLAGVVSWVLVIPLDVIKSKIISDKLAEPQYKGPWDCVKKTYAEGGAVRFFQGFWLICIRAFPVNAMSFLVYEMFLNMFDSDVGTD